MSRLWYSYSHETCLNSKHKILIQWIMFSISTLFAGLELELVAGVVWEKNIAGWLVAGSWCWSGVRGKHCWAGGCWSCRTEWSKTCQQVDFIVTRIQLGTRASASVAALSFPPCPSCLHYSHVAPTQFRRHGVPRIHLAHSAGLQPRAGAGLLGSPKIAAPTGFFPFFSFRFSFNNFCVILFLYVCTLWTSYT